MSIRKGSKTIAGAPLESVWGTISGNIADQEDLKNLLDGKADVSSAELVGTPTAPTPPIGSYNDRIATTKFVSDSIGSAGIIPPQQGHGGEFLSTDGESAFWAVVDTFPEQEGQSGKFLTTDGTSVSWSNVDLSGKVDKVTSTSSKNRFYIVTPAGVQSTLEGEQTGQTAATVPIRTSTGTIRTATPSDNNDAATKKYVDDGLKEKLDGYNINVAGAWTGGAHAVKFVTVDYSGADSENGVFIKISMVNSHGNGITGRFFQDIILNVNYTGTVAGTIYRYFAESVDSSMSYSDHKWGDVFWTIDTTNKIVKFFVLMRQYSYTYETPYFRLNASTKGEITQHSGVNSEEYSSGTQYWATIYDYNEIPVQTGQSGKFLTTNGTSVSWSSISQVPSQSGQSGKFLTTNGTTASWANVDAFPSQSGNNGKFLTTNGSSVSWATVDALPTQSGQSGKFLTTDGTYASWTTIDAFPTQTGQSGKFLTTNGSSVSWANAPTEIPSQSGNSGKFLTTNGSSVSWANIDALKNNSTGNYSLSILGTSSHAYETIIGSGTSSSNAGTVVVGANASAVGADSTALGYNAHTNAASAIQIGEGTNSSAATLSIGFGESSGTVRNYTLLIGSSGKIPDERLNNPIPSQSGQSGKYLTTDGSSASWASISIPVVDQTYDGTSANAQSGIAVKSAIDSAISSVYKPAGSVVFANLPTLGSTYEGYVYNVSDDFTTTADFVEGAGHSYPAGTNVVCVNTATSGTAVYKWDVLAGFVDLSGYVKKDGGNAQQTISLTSGTGTTAFGVKSMSTGSYISFSGTNGWLASYGVTSEKKPTFYNGSSYTLAYVENTVASNTAITGATKCKITYDSKGLVTAGADLTASDIPNLSLSKITDVTASATELNYVDGVTSNVQTQLDNKPDFTDYSLIVPDTSKMEVLKTITYTVSANSAYRFGNFSNNISNLWDIKGDAIFRITVTGTNINQQIEGMISMRQALDSPFIVIRNRRGNSSAATSGIRYIYSRYPKALNSGYNWQFDFACYDATERTIKIEILKNDIGFSWEESLTSSSYDSTNQSSATLTAYTTDGIIGIPTLNWAAISATTAGYLTSYIPKMIGGTQPLAGAALLASQLCFMSSNKMYPSTSKTLPIDTGYGICFNSTATSSGSATTYNYLRQKISATSLTNIPHATLARGNSCYFRCTMDANGNILSDNYVATSMAAGYTWYYIGIAQSSSAINIDTTNSVFLTLDSNGSLTHINGKKITTTDLSNYQTKITSSAKLSADLISDGTTNKTVTATEKSTWSGKQDALVSGTNIKTINNQSILGSGNIDIQGGTTVEAYTATEVQTIWDSVTPTS